jgi:4-hydroxy-3-polyprenylbenzoate decarboxylase
VDGNLRVEGSEISSFRGAFIAHLLMRYEGEPGIHQEARFAASWIPGSRRQNRLSPDLATSPGMTFVARQVMLEIRDRSGADNVMTGPPSDFQEHLARLEAQGLLLRIERPINKDTELHPLVRWQFQGGLAEDSRRAFLFTNVTDAKGRRYDIPVAVGAFGASARIYSVGMGRPVPEIELAWAHAIAHPIPPVRVGQARSQEVVIRGDELHGTGKGLAALPVPISTPGFDAAPYLTATLAVTRDPETGIQNMGTYRAGLKATDRLGVRMAARIGGAGGYQHWRKYRERKIPMPCAFVIGCAPVVFFTGPMKLALDVDEMAVAGALSGAPIPVVRCVTVDLDVPADAEIVIEGLIDPELLEPEGPFGESHGHVALEDFNMSMRVTAITRKRSPVFASIISEVTPSESSTVKRVAYEPMFLAHLRDKLSIKGVRKVVMHEPLTNLRKVIFVQFAQGVPRTEIWRGLHGAATLLADCGKICIAVSEDIDPVNTDAIFWSLAYRANPIEDVHILPYRSAGHGPKSAPQREESTLLIDATLKTTAPPLALPARGFMERARGIWEELGLPAISPQPPWHGYSLGDWAEDWETYARRAVAGDWEQNGEATFARRRAGITPETPVRDVEGKKGS